MNLVEARTTRKAFGSDQAFSPHQHFETRLHSVLAAPMPRCLCESFTLSHIGTAEGEEADDAVKVLNKLPVPQRNPPVRRQTSPRTPPIYEVLLQKGRLLQEHRERLQQEAIEREMCNLRPAPYIPVAPAPIPVEAARSASRLPPKGQRIEDKLLQRAKEKQAAQELASKARSEREAEELAAVAPFHPQISPRAQSTKSRYRESVSVRKAWWTKQLEELHQRRLRTEAQALLELRSVPSIDMHSARLAARRKAREGLTEVSVEDALLIHEHDRQLSLWKAAEAQRKAQAQASPAITQSAARMSRLGNVGDRLHAESYHAAIRRLQSEVEWREAHTPFQPFITPLGAVTTPRYRCDGCEVSGGEPLRSLHSSQGSSGPPPPSFRPAIDPISAAIAQRLPETPMERLCRPSAVHSLSSYTDPVPSLDTSRVSPFPSSSQSSATPRSAHRTPSRARPGRTSLCASTPRALSQSMMDSLGKYEHKRRARLDHLRCERAQQEQRECTFHPQIDAHSSSLLSASHAVVDQRGPHAVAQRNEEWQRQRERHLEMMRQWQAERTLRTEMLETRRPPGVTRATAAELSCLSQPSRSVYGGDGTPWGVAEYLARQRLARAQRQERQSGCT